MLLTLGAFSSQLTSPTSSSLRRRIDDVGLVITTKPKGASLLPGSTKPINARLACYPQMPREMVAYTAVSG
jgi:hypothetical protein